MCPVPSGSYQIKACTPSLKGEVLLIRTPSTFGAMSQMRVDAAFARMPGDRVLMVLTLPWMPHRLPTSLSSFLP